MLGVVDIGCTFGSSEMMFRTLRSRQLVGPRLPLNSVNSMYVSLGAYSAIISSYGMVSVQSVLVMNPLWRDRHAHAVDVGSSLQRLEHLQA